MSAADQQLITDLYRERDALDALVNDLTGRVVAAEAERDQFRSQAALFQRTPALDPFAWDALALHEELVDVPGSYVDNIVAWSRFCYWAAQSNLAAHFLPTEAAARTRASNGRDVPPAYMDVRLPVDCAKDWASLDPTNPLWYRSVPPTIEACRRALGAS